MTPEQWSQAWRAGRDAAAKAVEEAFERDLDVAAIDVIRALEPPPMPGEVATDPERIYPCDRCGLMRTKAEGGTVFTVCDACWDATVKPTARDRCETCQGVQLTGADTFPCPDCYGTGWAK